jgi:hypothetical protein
MAKKTKIEREIQVQIRKAKRFLKDALKDYVYDKTIDKVEFLRRLVESKNTIDELITKVSSESQEIPKEEVEVVSE